MIVFFLEEPWLQWGRGLVTTEIADPRGNQNGVHAASMGPWPGDHGNAINTRNDSWRVTGFNGAVAW